MILFLFVFASVVAACPCPTSTVHAVSDGVKEIQFQIGCSDTIDIRIEQMGECPYTTQLTIPPKSFARHKVYQCIQEESGHQFIKIRARDTTCEVIELIFPSLTQQENRSALKPICKSMLGSIKLAQNNYDQICGPLEL